MVYDLYLDPPPVPLKYPSRLGGNAAGQYKRAVALALFVGIGNVIGVVASNICRTEDAPQHKLGRESHWS